MSAVRRCDPGLPSAGSSRRPRPARDGQELIPMPRPTALSLAALGAAMSASLGVAGTDRPRHARRAVGTYDARLAGGGTSQPTALAACCPTSGSRLPGPGRLVLPPGRPGRAQGAVRHQRPRHPVTAGATSVTIPRTQTDFSVWIVAKGEDGDLLALGQVRRGVWRVDLRPARDHAGREVRRRPLEAGAVLPGPVLPGLAAARPLDAAGLRRLRRLPRGFDRGRDGGRDGRRGGGRGGRAWRWAWRSA